MSCFPVGLVGGGDLVQKLSTVPRALEHIDSVVLLGSLICDDLEVSIAVRVVPPLVLYHHLLVLLGE